MGFQTTYNSWYRQYIVHTKYGGFQSNKDEIFLPCIDTIKPQDVAFVKITK